MTDAIAVDGICVMRGIIIPPAIKVKRRHETFGIPTRDSRNMLRDDK